jgi:hypothetical protein
VQTRIGIPTRALTVPAGIVVAVLAVSTVRLPAQAESYRAPRLPGTAQPNLAGIWQAVGTAHWDIEDHPAQPPPLVALGALNAVPAGDGIVEGGSIPYLPWAAAKKKENFAKRMTIDPHDRAVGDPEAKCYLPGVPRATYMPFPFQILQSTDEVTIAYEYASATRVINLKNHQEPSVDTWMGTSNGRWDGETLVVDATGFNGLAWFDRAGNFASDTLHVVERYTPITPYHLQYEATIEDPTVFSRPWKVSLPLYRRLDSGARVREFKCVEFVEPALLGTLSKPSGN